jgi:hypothetical protein
LPPVKIASTAFRGEDLDEDLDEELDEELDLPALARASGIITPPST